MAKHTVHTEWNGNMEFTSTNPGGELIIDADKSVGGNDNGLRPKALMLSSLAGCSAMDVASLLKKMRAEPKSFNIEINAQLSEEHPKYYTHVFLDYNFYGTDLQIDKIEKAVGLSVEKYCGVMHMFRSFAKVEHKIHFFDQ